MRAPIKIINKLLLLIMKGIYVAGRPIIMQGISIYCVVAVMDGWLVDAASRYIGNSLSLTHTQLWDDDNDGETT